MGKVEKIVVLSVLFVIVLILVLSDPGGQKGGDVHAAGGPAVSASRTFDREQGVVSAEEDPVSREHAIEASAGAVGQASPPGPTDGSGGEGLLVAVQLSGPIYQVPDSIPEDWALKSLGGLADHHFDPTHKVYLAKDGDTFESLAERYYGDASYARLLRRANEGQAGIEGGQQLLVPTHEDGIAAEPAVVAVNLEGATTYVALSGESLWIIAKKNYGKGHLWPRIWEANQGTLANPDAVPEGVTLVIPAAE
jgi:nucleoid-associated protein YgaU